MSAGLLGRNLAAHDHLPALFLHGTPEHRQPEQGHNNSHNSMHEVPATERIGTCALRGVNDGHRDLVSVRVGVGAGIGPAAALVEAMALGDADGCTSIFTALDAPTLLASTIELAKVTLASLVTSSVFDDDLDSGVRSDFVMAVCGQALLRTTRQLPVEPEHCALFCGDIAAHLVLDPTGKRISLHSPKVTVAVHTAAALSAYVRDEVGISASEQADVWREVTLAAATHPARGI